MDSSESESGDICGIIEADGLALEELPVQGRAGKIASGTPYLKPSGWIFCSFCEAAPLPIVAKAGTFH